MLERLRDAIKVVVERVAPGCERPTDLQRVLKLDNHMAWSVFNLACSANPYAVVSLMPGERAIAKFFDRVAAHDVDEEIVDAARAATTEFEEMVSTYAGHREMFEAMVANLASERDDGESEIDIKHRRIAFRSDAIIWRRQIHQRFSCMMVHPSPKQGLTDRLLLTGHIGYQQTRPGLPMRVRGFYHHTPHENEPAEVVVEPLDPDVSVNEPLGLLKPFCTHPIPTFQSITRDPQNAEYAFIPKSLGVPGEATIFLGRIIRNCGVIPICAPDDPLFYSTAFGIPTENAVVELFVHESLWDDQLPQVDVYGFGSAKSSEFPESDRLPVQEKIAFVGRGFQANKAPDVPRYNELLNYTFDRTGWNPKEFMIFRSTIQYPILHTTIRYLFKRP